MLYLHYKISFKGYVTIVMLKKGQRDYLQGKHEWREKHKSEEKGPQYAARRLLCLFVSFHVWPCGSQITHELMCPAALHIIRI